jgi:hypothetical protein
VTLHAIAGARLPATLVISAKSRDDLRKGIWELRTYRSSEALAIDLAQDFASIFARSGIRPLTSATEGRDITYLIRFENLAARERAWTAVNADPQWAAAARRFRNYRFGVYRAD